MKNTITIPAKLINKEFTQFEDKDINIEAKYLISESKLQFYYKIPDYIYDALVDTEEEYMAKKLKYKWDKKESVHFGRNIIVTDPNYIVKRLFDLGTVLQNREYLKTVNKEPKLFIKYCSQISNKQWDKNSAFMGKSVSSEFVYFTGFKVNERSSLRGTSHGYYTDKHSNTMGRAPQNEIDDFNTLHPQYSAGLVSLCDNNGSSVEAFETEYIVIDWSQEREDFLKSVQDKFISLGEMLSNYFTKIDNESIGQMITDFKNSGIKLLT